MSVMNEFKFASELLKRSQELSKAEASTITPKAGTSVLFNKFFCKAGSEEIKRLQSEAETKISANKERYSEKVAGELNLPIITELNESIQAIKNTVRSRVNENIDARVQRINETRSIPVRDSRMKMFQTIKMLLDLNADISEGDWKAWGEQCAGHYLEEKIFESLANTRKIPVVPTINPEKNIEQLETFRAMANNTIDHLDNVDDNLMALSFLNDNPDAPLGQLVNEIDNDLASIIPAEKLTLLQRLKDAKQNAFDKDNVTLSVKIGNFIDKNIDKLATPEELVEPLYTEAENFIVQGMSAKRE